MLGDMVAVVSISSISSLGIDDQHINESYQAPSSNFISKRFESGYFPVACLDNRSSECLNDFVASNSSLEQYDRTVHMGTMAARRVMKLTGWRDDGQQIGICVGSARGATGLIEAYHSEFQKSPESRLPPCVSPSTTAGSLSSGVGQLLGLSGPSISHSVTCSSGLHALLTAYGWIRGGLIERFLVGGVEAALTEFTLAQMHALRLYSRYSSSDFPCRPFEDAIDARSSLVLGEAASFFALQGVQSAKRDSIPILGIISGIGFAIEKISSMTSITDNGDGLECSMRKALGKLDPSEVDLLIAHAPGSIKGDQAELRAIDRVFKNKRPLIYSNKFLVGHTFGASGTLSLDLAIRVINGLKLDFSLPYRSSISNKSRTVQRVLVNAAGFGGNCVSVLISKAE